MDLSLEDDETLNWEWPQTPVIPALEKVEAGGPGLQGHLWLQSHGLPGL